jgi:glutathione S-transferase
MTMKLYYSPGACSLSPHIILNEGGFSFEIEKVDLVSKKTESGADFTAINPKSYVPALLLNDGQVLTEGPAIIQYLADSVPEKKLIPAAGSMERYRVMEWLNFISTELHKGFGPLFNAKAPAEWKTLVKAQLLTRINYVGQQLEGKNWLMGTDFTVADAYLFTVLSWANHVGLDLTSIPQITGYLKRVASRPLVQATLKAEGLLD